MKRYILYIIMVLFCFLLQTTFFQWLELAGIVPNILVLLVVSIGYMRGTNEAMFTGVLCGLCMDLMYGNYIGFYALLYLTIGFISGYSNYFYEPDDYTVPLILIGAGDLVYGFLFYILSFLLRARLNFFYYLRRIMVPEAVYTVVAAIILFKIIHAIEKWMVKKESKED